MNPLTVLDIPVTARTAVWADMKKRMRTIAIGLPIVMVIVFAGNIPTLAGALLIAVMVTVEIAHMIDQNSRQNLLLAVPAAFLATLAIAFDRMELLAVAISLVLIPGALLAVRASQSRLKLFVDHYLHLAAGVLYVSVPMGFLAMIRAGQNGLAWTIYLLFVTWATDSMGLIGGRLFGRHKLAPTISPGKTVEGAAFGYGMGIVMALITALAAQLPWHPVIPAALLIPLLVICGDLVESWTKRYFDVKDSGSLLPGHGGFFDRADGLILATPVLYFILLLAGMI